MSKLSGFPIQQPGVCRGGGGGKILLQYTETVLKYDWPRNKDSYLKVPELGQVNLE